VNDGLSDDSVSSAAAQGARRAVVSRALPILALVTTIAFTIKQVASAGMAVVDLVHQVLRH
jgi:hypothetical protein